MQVRCPDLPDGLVAWISMLGDGSVEVSVVFATPSSSVVRAADGSNVVPSPDSVSSVFGDGESFEDTLMMALSGNDAAIVERISWSSMWRESS